MHDTLVARVDRQDLELILLVLLLLLLHLDLIQMSQALSLLVPQGVLILKSDVLQNINIGFSSVLLSLFHLNNLFSENLKELSAK